MTMELSSATRCLLAQRTYFTQLRQMETPQPKKQARRRGKSSGRHQSAPSPVISEVVMPEEVKATPIVEPAPEPTPIPEPEEAPTSQPKAVKPWELVRPMAPTNNSAWQRGQKWRP